MELENRFLETGSSPGPLTLIFCAAQGDRKDKGLNHLAHDGLRPAGDGRPLGPCAEDRQDGGGEQDSRLCLSAGRHVPPAARLGGPPAGHHHPRGPGHLCRPPQRRRQGQRADPLGPRPGPPDEPRRQGLPVLRLPEGRLCAAVRHLRRRERQHQHGEVRGHRRDARHRPGLQEQRRHRGGAGRAGGQERLARPQEGRDSRHPGRRGGAGQRHEVPHADL